MDQPEQRSNPIHPMILYIGGGLCLLFGAGFSMDKTFVLGLPLLVASAFLLLMAAGTSIKYNQGSIEEPKDTAHEQDLKARRDRQIATLKATVPSGPPEKMRATIQLNSFTALVRRQETANFKFGGGSYYVFSKYVDETRYAVDMILQLTERERAIIRQHQLFDIILDDEPLYSSAELAKLKTEYRQQADSESRNSKHEILLNEFRRVELDNAKDQRRKTSIGDLLVSPFSREFDTQNDATQYADKLKTKLLPTMKNVMDRYRDFQATETVEF